MIGGAREVHERCTRLSSGAQVDGCTRLRSGAVVQESKWLQKSKCPSAAVVQA